MVSNESLRTILRIENHDLITPFGWSENREYEAKIIKALTLQNESDLQEDRVTIYVCPECGDSDCGAVTAKVFDRGDRIVWQDFGYETGYGGLTERYTNIQPIEFERNEYFKAFDLIDSAS